MCCVKSKRIPAEDCDQDRDQNSVRKTCKETHMQKLSEGAGAEKNACVQKSIDEINREARKIIGDKTMFRFFNKKGTEKNRFIEEQKFPAENIIGGRVQNFRPLKELLKKGFLPEESLLLLLLVMGRECLSREETLLKIDIPEKNIYVFGDTHGSFSALAKTIEHIEKKLQSGARVVMNGDFVDRGKESIELVVSYVMLKLEYVDHFFLLRGNHEYGLLNRKLGLYDECCRHYGENGDLIHMAFNDMFAYLPLSAVIGGEIFVTHGGITRDCSLKQIESVKRPMTVYARESAIFNLVWADPCDGEEDGISSRGLAGSILFGEKTTEEFLTKNRLKMVIRSHEFVQEGFRLQHRGRVATIFSSPCYKNGIPNTASYLSISRTGNTKGTVYRVPGSKLSISYAVRNIAKHKT